MVTSVSSTTGTSSTTATNPGATLGKNDFLKLLVSELQNQDPLSPTDSSQYMQEMTEFSTVEQLTNLNQTATSMQSQGQVGQAVSLLGHTLTYVDSTGATQSGTAGSVTIAADGSVRIMVGTTAIGLAQVRGVK